jgi:hypothetical protein
VRLVVSVPLAAGIPNKFQAYLSATNRTVEIVHVGIHIGNFRLDWHADELVHIHNLGLKPPENPMLILPPLNCKDIRADEANLRIVRYKVYRSSFVFRYVST